MRTGSKKIYHLEAWVIKVMSLYKVSSSIRKKLPDPEGCFHSTFSTTSTCPTSIDNQNPRSLLWSMLCANGFVLLSACRRYSEGSTF